MTTFQGSSPGASATTGDVGERGGEAHPTLSASDRTTAITRRESDNLGLLMPCSRLGESRPRYRSPSSSSTRGATTCHRCRDRPLDVVECESRVDRIARLARKSIHPALMRKPPADLGTRAAPDQRCLPLKAEGAEVTNCRHAASFSSLRPQPHGDPPTSQYWSPWGERFWECSQPMANAAFYYPDPSKERHRADALVAPRDASSDWTTGAVAVASSASPVATFPRTW